MVFAEDLLLQDVNKPQRTGLKLHRCKTNSLSEKLFKLLCVSLYFTVLESIRHVAVFRQQESNKLPFLFFFVD